MSSPKFLKVIISDYSRWESGRDNNGGAYGFETTYTPAGKGRYRPYHWTTAEFSYCPDCGRWGCECGTPIMVTEIQLEQIIARAEQDPSDRITARVELTPEGVEYFRRLRRRVEDHLRKCGDEELLVRVAALCGVLA